MRVEESIEIERPPEAVWEVVAEPVNDPRLVPEGEVGRTGGGTSLDRLPQAGAATKSDRAEPRTARAPAPNRLSLRQEDEASVFHVEYRLEPSETGTRFTQISEFEWKKLPRVLHGTFARGVRRDVRDQLRQLKRLLEA